MLYFVTHIHTRLVLELSLVSNLKIWKKKNLRIMISIAKNGGKHAQTKPLQVSKLPESTWCYLCGTNTYIRCSSDKIGV